MDQERLALHSPGLATCTKQRMLRGCITAERCDSHRQNGIVSPTCNATTNSIDYSRHLQVSHLSNETITVGADCSEEHGGISSPLGQYLARGPSSPSVFASLIPARAGQFIERRHFHLRRSIYTLDRECSGVHFVDDGAH